MILRAAFGWLCTLCLTMVATSQEVSSREQNSAVADSEDRGISELRLPRPAAAVESVQRLLMDQVEELIRSGEISEALSNLEKLFDQADGFVVPGGGRQRAGTLVSQRYIPVRQWVRDRLHLLVQQSEAARQEYQARIDAVANASYRRLQASQDLATAEIAAEQFSETRVGLQLQFLLADLYLERGWTIAAQQALYRLSPELFRAPIGNAVNGPPGAGLPWPLVWESYHNRSDSMRMAVAEQYREDLRLDVDKPVKRRSMLIDALERYYLACEIHPELCDLPLIKNWNELLVQVLDDSTNGEKLNLEVPEASTSVDPPSEDWLTFAGNSRRSKNASALGNVGRWPVWGQAVPLFMATQDLVPASQPRVGESERAVLSYHPVVYQGRVFVHALTEILAFDLQSGKSWPNTIPARPLFDSRTSQSDFLPLGYPYVGTPRGLLTIEDGVLYARMGQAVTGWANQGKSAGERSTSYLIGLDLERQGSMANGFPLFLQSSQFENAEFEGPPVVFGDLLIAPIVQRDNVGLRRSLAAFERNGGKLVWHSRVLASGIVAGSQGANLISNQQICLAGGRIFYNTNLGSVACLNPLNGELLWLTQYASSLSAEEGTDDPQRYRYRDVNPGLVQGGLIYCAPQDCGEIFALDVTTGDLAWSTTAEVAGDAIHLLGIYNKHLVAGGDQLIWLDRHSGRLAGRFPAAHTPGPTNALPSPRGLGRGAIGGDRIYWPIAGEILVFAADLDFSTTNPGLAARPQLLKRIPLGARGTDGGNLVLAQNNLVYASAMRVMMLR